MTTTIAMPSLTHAMKGQKVLQAAGYHTQVHKTKQGNAQGCGYSLQVVRLLCCGCWSKALCHFSVIRRSRYGAAGQF